MRRVLIFLLIGLLILAMFACKISDDPDGDADNSITGNTAEQAINATATYGAEQWHAQLTAIAETPEP